MIAQPALGEVRDAAMWAGEKGFGHRSLGIKETGEEELLPRDFPEGVGVLAGACGLLAVDRVKGGDPQADHDPFAEGKRSRWAAATRATA